MKPKCKGCGFPKYGSSVGIIWLSIDGYCSVCNHYLKNRERKIIGMDNFIKTTIIYTPKGYPYLNDEGGKMTNKRKLLEEIRSKNKMMNVPSEYRKAKNKGKKILEDFI